MYQQKTTLFPNSLFEKSQQIGLNYVLNLNPDKLLSPCYTALGKNPKTSTYGGWESRQIQGHSLGHYLSALSGFYYQTKNDDAKKKIDYTIKCIKEIQRNDGYFGGIPSTPFDTVFTSNGDFQVERFSLASWWVPWYSVHKIYAGILDAYTFAKNDDALDIVKKMANWAINGSKNMTDLQFQKMLECEHGGMCKVFADLYEITGEKKYLTMAERFIHQEIINPLIKKIDKLQGYHANTQIPKVIGLAKLYELTKKEDYKTAVEFFFETVTKKRSYVIGGNSIGEHFGAEYDEKLGKDTAETCNSYNMLELAEHVFQWSKNPEVADFYEAALYNHILASQDPKTGAKTYFVAMIPGFFKIYGTQENAFWCCTGTGMENPERYNRFIAIKDKNDLYINLFIPSTIITDDDWKIQIETSFPYEQKVKIIVLEKGKNPLNIKIRNPFWAKNDDKSAYKKTSYIEYKNVTEKTEIEKNLPMKLTIRKTHDKTGNFSILYGPIVLAADIGNKNMPCDIVDNHLVYMNEQTENVSPITKKLDDFENWIEPLNIKNLTFKTKAEANSQNISYTLKPFFDIHHTKYAVYFYSKSQNDDDKTKIEKSTVDFVEIGRQQSEIEHNFINNGSSIGFIQNLDKNCRILESENSSISYKMQFDKTKSNKIIVTFCSEDFGKIEVLVEDTKVSTISVNDDKNDKSKKTEKENLIEREIEINEKLIDELFAEKKDSKLKITLKPSSKNIPKILELRVIR